MRRALALLLASGCAAAPAAAPSPAPRVIATAPPAAAPPYLATFHEVVDKIHRWHSFSPALATLLGHPWDDELPALEKQFAAAATKSEATDALIALENSLHDRHLHFEATSAAPGQWYELGFKVIAEGTIEAPIFTVSKVTDAKGLRVGDRIVGRDGATIAQWVRAHLDDNSAIQPEGLLANLASRFAQRPLTFTERERNVDLTKSVVELDIAGRQVALRWAPVKESENASIDIDLPRSYATLECEPRGEAKFGHDYRLTRVGVNVCIFESTTEPYRAYPIVRYPSFDYGLSEDGTIRAIHADRDLLARALGAKGIKSVLLDMRDNPGGINPYIFMRWFFGKPFEHALVHMPVHHDLTQVDELSHAFYSRRIARTYVAATTTELIVPFLCGDRECPPDGPGPDRVTSAPLVLLLGPGCVSSCDTFAVTAEQFGLAKLVGRQPSTAFTVNRYTFVVEGFGRFGVALSWSSFGEHGEPFEGRPRHLDLAVPLTAANADHYDAELVERAVAMVEKPPSVR